ncbi:MAG: hypothetical protein OEZ01_01370 [Candidatus Heimdallarchaeota archaeon]|nr:hypothetical protein [Candidatus Heimdallarchaeota archaeon]MDH5644623.1 hypothetical protein [Candidatus Heimdallarchaeota archaeon]
MKIKLMVLLISLLFGISFQTESITINQQGIYVFDISVVVDHEYYLKFGIETISNVLETFNLVQSIFHPILPIYFVVSNIFVDDLFCIWMVSSYKIITIGLVERIQ